MYRPAHFQQNDPATLAAFMDSHPLAVLVAAPPTGIVANHIPLLRLQDAGGRMLLHGHVARGNDFWKITPAESPVLAIFGGPDRYISPAWYPTKAETGEVVPTWNYLVVHAHGRITFTQDTTWLLTLVEALTDRHEAIRPLPWKVSDAPTDTGIACCGPSSGSRSSSRDWRGNSRRARTAPSASAPERGPV